MQYVHFGNIDTLELLLIIKCEFVVFESVELRYVNDVVFLDVIYKLFICSCHIFWVLIELQVATGEHLSHDMPALSLEEVLWVDRASVDLLTNLCLQPLNSLLFDIIMFVLFLGFHLILLWLRKRGHLNLHFIAKGQNIVNLADLIDDSDAVL